jgi:hypothetical protein
MDKLSRRETVRAYKERKVPQGIFALRCATTGESWVGTSRNLDQQQNGIWFTLRHGGHPNRDLQAAWREHGSSAFIFEVVETLETEDLGAFGLESLLKGRERHWLGALSAQKVVG